MSIKDRIDQDLKQALLSGDKVLVTTLRGLKSAILYVEVANNSREAGLDEATVISVLTKEAKKRQESAELYAKAGDKVREQSELQEKAVIDQYLPQQMTDEELERVVDEVLAEHGVISQQTMGKAIGAVKAKVGAQADGGRIAQAVKRRVDAA